MLPRHTFKSLALILACITFTARAQDTLAISPRVGTVLDAYECRYFGLFPKVEVSGGIVFQNLGRIVSVTNGGERIMQIEPELTRLLGTYIDEYDSLIWHLRGWGQDWELNERFEQLQDAKLVRPFTRRDRADIEVLVRGNRERQGQTHRGVLLWADEHRFILRPEGGSMSAASDTIYPADITAISIYEGTAVVRGLVIGALIGGAVGLVTGLGSGGYTNTGYHTLEPGGVAFLTGMGIVIFGGIGALLGTATPALTQTDIGNLDEYHRMLPKLRARMIYGNGLPPELR